jgi:hypothetical protein
MATTPIQPQQNTIPPAKKPRPRWLMITLLAVGGLMLLIGGVAIGAAANSKTSLINSQKAQITRLQSTVSTDKSQLSTERLRVTNAQAQARNAMSVALTQVKGQYKSKFAALQAQEQKVAGLQAKLNRELGVVAKSTISQDGVYVVGRDIPSGVYHTSGNNGGFNNQCYYATLGSTNTSNILDNNNFNGPETVDLSGVYAFQITGGCTWHKIG